MGRNGSRAHEAKVMVCAMSVNQANVSDSMLLLFRRRLAGLRERERERGSVGVSGEA